MSTGTWRSTMPVYVGTAIVFFLHAERPRPSDLPRTSDSRQDGPRRGCPAGLALSLALFATRVATAGDGPGPGPGGAKVFTRILATAFLLLTPTLIQGCTTNVTAQSIRREAQLKFAILLNSIVLLVVALLTSNLAIAY